MIHTGGMQKGRRRGMGGGAGDQKLGEAGRTVRRRKEDPRIGERLGKRPS